MCMLTICLQPSTGRNHLCICLHLPQLRVEPSWETFPAKGPWSLYLGVWKAGIASCIQASSNKGGVLRVHWAAIDPVSIQNCDSPWHDKNMDPNHWSKRTGCHMIYNSRLVCDWQLSMLNIHLPSYQFTKIPRYQQALRQVYKDIYSCIQISSLWKILQYRPALGGAITWHLSCRTCRSS